MRTDDVPFEGQYKTGNLTIQCSNAYLPASVGDGLRRERHHQLCSSAPGTKNLPLIHVNTNRVMRRVTLGADGAVTAFGSDWSWDAYFEHGADDYIVKDFNESLTNLYNMAIDAVTGRGRQLSFAAPP